MRYVFKLMLLAVFSVAATLMIGCGDTTKKDTNAKDDKTKTENVKTNSDKDDSSAKVSTVSFDVEGMT